MIQRNYSAGNNIVLREDDIIVRYDGPPEVGDDCQSCYDPEEEDVDQFVEEELRIAESMSMEVFLNLNITCLLYTSDAADE